MKTRGDVSRFVGCFSLPRSLGRKPLKQRQIWTCASLGFTRIEALSSGMAMEMEYIIAFLRSASLTRTTPSEIRCSQTLLDAASSQDPSLKKPVAPTRSFAEFAALTKAPATLPMTPKHSARKLKLAGLAWSTAGLLPGGEYLHFDRRLCHNNVFLMRLSQIVPALKRPERLQKLLKHSSLPIHLHT